jgi:hypothetical protein
VKIAERAYKDFLEAKPFWSEPKKPVSEAPDKPRAPDLFDAVA